MMMKTPKTFWVVALCGLLLCGGYATAQVKSMVAPAAPQLSAAKTTVKTNAKTSIAMKQAEAAREKGLKTEKTQTLELRQIQTSFVARPVAKSSVKDETKAKISVSMIESYYNDGTGEVVFIDSTGTAYEETEGWLPEDYAGYFQSSIPAGALSDPFDTEKQLFAGDDDYAEVEPGTYDLILLNPSDETLWSAGGWLDNVQLKAGYELCIVVDYYNVTVQLLYPFDIAPVGVVVPSPIGVGFTAEEEVVAQIGNNGLNRIQGFKLQYKFDNGEFFTEEFEQNILSGKVENVPLAHKADFSALGRHTVTLIASIDGDEADDNDTVVAEIFNVEPVTDSLPFTYSFSDSASFFADWYIDDANGNGESWTWYEYSDWEGNIIDTSARIYYNDLVKGSPESMIHFRPFHLTPGKYHISFYVKTAGYKENFEVLLGTDVVNLDVVGKYDEYATKNEWVMEVVNLTVENEGDYFLGFRDYYTNGYFVCIDNIELGEGMFIGTPDLRIDGFTNLASSCVLGNEDIYVSLSNIGYGNIESIAVKLDINGTIAIDDTIEVVLDARSYGKEVKIGSYDFSETDVTYMLSLEINPIIAEGGKPEDSTNNNFLDFEFNHWTAASLPFMSNFQTDRALGNWAMGNWEYDDQVGGYVYAVDTFPMSSRCLDLEAGKDYRFFMNYAAGADYGWFAFTTDYEILCGKTGTDWKTWDTIHSEKDAFEDDFTDMDFTFSVKESGSYTVALRVKVNGGFYVHEIIVSEVMDYDVRINSLAPVPVMIPAEHANGTYNMWAEVENRGKKTVDAKVSVKVNGTAAGSATVGNMAADSIAETPVELTVAGAVAGATNVPIVAGVEVVGHEDGYTGDNTLYYSTNITDDILGYDYVTEQMCTDVNRVVGSSYGTLMCVVPIYLTKKDTLTAINVMWGATEEATAHETRIVVYNFNYETGEVGDIIYSGIERKEAMTGEQSFTVPALLLESGFYLIGADINGYELTVDGDANGVTYMLSEGVLYSQTNLGNAGIRAKFGHDGKVVAADAKVLSIDKPADKGVFSANEPIVATVMNMGYAPITAKVSLMVDGVAVNGEVTLELEAYETKPASFTADLSALGKHELAVTATCEGDADESNNTLEKTVECIDGGNPYIMDFEQCEDFAIDNFLPAWTVYDGDQSPTYGFQGLQFPHMGEPMAFIAFNPGVLSETMTPAYEGERYGACFAATSYLNNDWLISPKLLLPEDEAEMTFMVQTYMDYGLEKYQVLVSETTNDPEAFTMLLAGEAPLDEWEKVTVDLKEYCGKEVYLAIRCVSEDDFIFMVDNIEISSPYTANRNIQKVDLKLYPNPARQMITITGAAIESVSIYNVSGRQVFASNSVKGDFRYNVSNLAKGMYFANVKTANGSVVLKFIVE